MSQCFTSLRTFISFLTYDILPRSHWSKVNGDDTITWGPDPLLTPTGIEQALDARKLWQKEIPFGVPVPSRHYSSPLKRALDTWKTTFVGDGARVTILEVCICTNMIKRKFS